MQSQEAIEKIHDELDDLLGIPGLQAMVTVEEFTWIWATRDALCWALGHLPPVDKEPYTIEKVLGAIRKQFQSGLNSRLN